MRSEPPQLDHASIPICHETCEAAILHALRSPSTCRRTAAGCRTVDHTLRGSGLHLHARAGLRPRMPASRAPFVYANADDPTRGSRLPGRLRNRLAAVGDAASSRQSMRRLRRTPACPTCQQTRRGLVMVERPSPELWHHAALRRFEHVDDYELHHLVAHLVAVHDTVQYVTSAADDSHAIQLLVKLLSDPAFALAKSSRMGDEPTTADFLAAHSTLVYDNPLAAKAISRGLAVGAILASAGNTPTLLPDTLQALLGHRTNTEMYAQIIEIVTQSDLLDTHVADAGTRGWLRRGFLHCAATMTRRIGGLGNLDTARELLVRASREDGSDESGNDRQPRAERLLSSVLYDLAYIDFLTGQAQTARDGFRASAQAAQRAGDLTRYSISSILDVLVGFYDQVVEANELQLLLTEALDCFQAAAAESPHAQRWIMNAHAHLFDIACIIGDEERAAAELRLLESDPWIVAFEQFEPRQRWRARFRLLTRDYAVACSLYEDLLANELTANEASCVREGAARDVLDYGRALDGIGKTQHAREVWERGLHYPDHAGNWPWKPRIERQLGRGRASATAEERSGTSSAARVGTSRPPSAPSSIA
jgi:tetratricopeptide (TPR) repeat protein